MEISLGSFKNNKRFAEETNANFMSRIILRPKKIKFRLAKNSILFKKDFP